MDEGIRRGHHPEEAMIRTFDKRYRGDHPMFAEPEEEKWCEWCGHSPEFCTCFEDLKFEEEKEEA